MSQIRTSLTLWIDRQLVGESADELFKLYKSAAEKHNNNCQLNKYQDAGFDILVPENGVEKASYSSDNFLTQVKIKTGIRCIMEDATYEPDQQNAIVCDEYFINHRMVTPKSFYMFPRSSISKTRYRLANSVGIIDSGYRGELIGVFDILPNQQKQDDNLDDIKPYSRFLQICSGDLKPFYVHVKICENDAEVKKLINSTTRGEGGFGSTGA